MKYLFQSILILFVFSFVKIYSQCGLGDIILNTQADVDNFSITYPGCHRVLGNIDIVGTQIANLDGLSVIDTVDRSLRITGNQELSNINGLKNLVYVNDFLISDCPLIKDLTGLQSLQNASNSLSLTQLTLKNLQGLNRLKFVRQLVLISNDSLENLIGIDSLKSTLTLSIFSNKQLKNLEGLKNDIDISQFYIHDNESLNSLANLSLAQLYQLNILNNPNLSDISGLSNLNTLWFLNIRGNGKLENLNAFTRLKTINIFIRIEENPILSDISGLKNVDATTLDSIIIQNNISLNHCHIESICAFLKDSNSIARIKDNASDCIDRKTVVNNCIKTGISDDSPLIIRVYPQVVDDILIVESAVLNSTIELINMHGQLIYSKFINANKEVLHLAHIAPGIYIIKIQNKYQGKIIKN